MARSAEQKKERDRKMTEDVKEKNSFSNLIEKIKYGEQDEKTIYALAQACVYSVLNKIQFTGYTEVIRQIKASVYSSQTLLSDGVTTEKAVSDRIGDGWDLVQVAAAEILSQIKQHGNDLELPYISERLSKHVWTSDYGVECKKENYTSCGIQEVYKAVRRAVQADKAVVTDPAQMATYVEYGQADIDNKPVYRRMLKPVDGKYVKSATTFTLINSKSDAERIDAILSGLRLTDKQMQVLKLRMRGYSERAIAQKLSITSNSVHGAMNRIREKAKKLCYV